MFEKNEGVNLKILMRFTIKEVKFNLYNLYKTKQDIKLVALPTNKRQEHFFKKILTNRK